MKEIKIDFIDEYSPANLYSTKDIYFSWLTAPKKNVLYQITKWHSCRETFVGELNKQFDEKRKWPYKYEINTTHTRFAATHKYINNMHINHFEKTCANNLRCAKHAKRLLNLFEKYLGWGLTTIYKCNNDNFTKHRIDMFVVYGSAKWLRSPQLMSLYLLIIRLSKNEYFQTLKNINDIKKFSSNIKNNDSQDIIFWKRINPYLFRILDNVNDLFFHQSIKNSHTEQSGTSGINNLVNGYSNKVTNGVFCKIKNDIDNKMPDSTLKR